MISSFTFVRTRWRWLITFREIRRKPFFLSNELFLTLLNYTYGNYLLKVSFCSIKFQKKNLINNKYCFLSESISVYFSSAGINSNKLIYILSTKDFKNCFRNTLVFLRYLENMEKINFETFQNSKKKICNRSSFKIIKVL